MKAENIIKILVEEKKYDKVQTERLSAKIDALSDDIKLSLENWIKYDTISSPEYSGYNVQKILTKNPNMTVLAAFLALDWIKKDPKTAIKALSTPIIKFTPNLHKKEK